MEDCFGGDEDPGDDFDDDTNDDVDTDENDLEIMTTIDLCNKFCKRICDEQEIQQCENCEQRCATESLTGLYLMLYSNEELVDQICPATEAITTTLEPTTTSTEFQTTIEATTEFATTIAPSICEDRRLFECPINSQCVSADTNHGYTCKCDDGFKMNGGSCEKITSEAQNCPGKFQNHLKSKSSTYFFCLKRYFEFEFETLIANFKGSLFKMKLTDLKNPNYFLTRGSVLIQVESQVVSRFRLNEETYTGFLEFTRRNCGPKQRLHTESDEI